MSVSKAVDGVNIGARLTINMEDTHRLGSQPGEKGGNNLNANINVSLYPPHIPPNVDTI